MRQLPSDALRFPGDARPHHWRPQAFGSNSRADTFDPYRGKFKVADDKAKQGQQDRSRVAGDELYEVEYFASKHGLSQAQARDLIKRVGNDRAKLNEAADKLKGEQGSG